MKHTIIDEYIFWLDKQVENEENNELTGLILRLKEDLININVNKNISNPYKNTLNCLSAYFLMKKKSNDAYVELSYEVFFEQINSWTNQLKALHSALLMTKEQLSLVETNLSNIAP